MKTNHFRLIAAFAALLWGCASTPRAAEAVPGSSVESLLAYAIEHNPELAAMRHEAQAADERIAPAGALPDPRFRATLQDITRMGEQNPTLLPARTGQTAYLWMQQIPWFCERDL